MPEFELRIVVLGYSAKYLFEHEECLFASVEVLRGFVSNEVARVGLVETPNHWPNVVHVF